MNYPIISIITPSFNQGQYIEETIQSVLSQKGDFYIDYIIIDGGSSDNTVDIIKNYENILKDQCELNNYCGYDFYQNTNPNNFRWNRCKGIQYRWLSEKDSGHADAINKGIVKVVGDIWTFINSDDFYLDGSFQTIIREFEKTPTIQILYGQAYYGEKGTTKLYNTQDINLYKKFFFSHCFICQPALFLRKEVVCKVGLFNTMINNSIDYEYWLRAINKAISFRHIDNIIAFSRLHDECKTNKNRKQIYNEIFQLVNTYKSIYKTSWPYQYLNEFYLLKYKSNKLRKPVLLIISFIYSLLLTVRLSYCNKDFNNS